jgi:hypothetical protein
MVPNNRKINYDVAASSGLRVFSEVKLEGKIRRQFITIGDLNQTVQVSRNGVASQNLNELTSFGSN